VVRTSSVNALTVVGGLQLIDQLICLATRLAVLRPISLSASCAPPAFQTAARALLGDGFNRQPLANRLLWTTNWSNSIQQFCQRVIELVDVHIELVGWLCEQHRRTEICLETHSIERADVA